MDMAVFYRQVTVYQYITLNPQLISVKNYTFILGNYETGIFKLLREGITCQENN
jgi:hypothetical protein